MFIAGMGTAEGDGHAAIEVGGVLAVVLDALGVDLEGAAGATIMDIGPAAD
jgi:hypothetical protein